MRNCSLFLMAVIINNKAGFEKNVLNNLIKIIGGNVTTFKKILT